MTPPDRLHPPEASWIEGEAREAERVFGRPVCLFDGAEAVWGSVAMPFVWHALSSLVPPPSLVFGAEAAERAFCCEPCPDSDAVVAAVVAEWPDSADSGLAR